MKNDLKEALETVRELLERGRGAEWLAVTQMELGAIRVLVDRVIGADPPTLPDKVPSLQPAGDTSASERTYGIPDPPPPPPPTLWTSYSLEGLQEALRGIDPASTLYHQIRDELARRTGTL